MPSIFATLTTVVIDGATTIEATITKVVTNEATTVAATVTTSTDGRVLG
jgi:hypothetical protein